MGIKILNKKGDFESMIYVITIIFIIGIILFFFNHLTDSLYTSLDEYFNTTEDFNETSGDFGHVRSAISELQDVETSGIWDYGFLFIALGMFVVLGFTAYSTRISPVFYWIYGILGLIFLALATIVSAIWQHTSSNSVFAETLTRFPITDTLLGTYYPTFIAGIVVITMIFLFGKSPGGRL